MILIPEKAGKLLKNLALDGAYKPCPRRAGSAPYEVTRLDPSSQGGVPWTTKTNTLKKAISLQRTAISEVISSN